MHEIGRPEHASTEQLSALLDDRAEPGDRWFLTEHVGHCERCESELQGLRSVQLLLRGLPVHMPPRDFTISAPLAQTRPRPSRLLPFTRALGALAAVLCVVFLSADALMLGTTSSKQFQAASDAAMITNATKVNGEDRAARSAAETVAESAATAKPADPAPAGRTVYPPPAAAAPAAPAPAQAQAKPAARPPVSQAARPAEAAQPAAAARPADVPPLAAAPAAAVAKPAAAAPPPTGAAAGAAAPASSASGSQVAPVRAAESAPPVATAASASTPAPLGTVTAFEPTSVPPLATTLPRSTSAAVVAPPPAPGRTGTVRTSPPAAARADMPVFVLGIEVTPLRIGGVILGIIAAVLFFCSAVVSRSARAA